MPSVTQQARDVAAKVRWLMAPRDPITWATLRGRLTTLPLLPSNYAGRVAVLVGILLLLLLVLPWYAKGHKDRDGVVTYPNAALVNPIIAGLGAALLIYAAIRQAQTASNRHAAQTEADRQRRITESFSKAIEQLGSDKLDVRLGGIYALERISQESPQDHWTVMENLTAFVRERTQRTEAERTAKPLDQRFAELAYSRWEAAGRPDGRSEEFWLEAIKLEKLGVGDPLATDIVTALTVIERRSEDDRAQEARDERVLDFHEAVLRGINLFGAHLERANLSGAHLECANLSRAHLEGADFRWAYLQEAYFFRTYLEGTRLSQADLQDAHLHEAHLEGTDLSLSHLEGANLREAHLQGADLSMAYLDGADLYMAYLDGADLRGARGLTQEQIDKAFGDAETKLPAGLTRPADWLRAKRRLSAA